MGVGDFLKNLFASKPYQIDYSSFPQERRLGLWEEQEDLTSEAKEILKAEAARRGLVLPEKMVRRPENKEPPTTWELLEQLDAAKQRRETQLSRRQGIEPIVSEPIVVVPQCGVALRTRGNRALLCLLPLHESDAQWTQEFCLEADLVIEAIVACNQTTTGYLPTSWVAGRLGVEQDAVFVLDQDRPCDRPLPGLEGGSFRGRRMSKRLDIGLLRLKPVTKRTDTLIASWSDPNEQITARAAIGPAIRFEEVASRNVNYVVGGLAVPDPELGALLDAVMGLRQVVFMLHVEGVTPWAEALAELGVNVSTVHWSGDKGSSKETPFERVGAAVASGDWRAVKREVVDIAPTTLEDIVTGLLIQPDREQDARRVLETACESNPDSGSAWFQRGAVAYLLGELDEAIKFYARTTEAQKAEPRAWANLAAIHLRRGDAEKALQCSETALQAMPTDPISLDHRLGSLLQLGRKEDARVVLEQNGAAFDAIRRQHWAQQVAEGTPPKWTHDTLPHLARPAYQCACSYRSQGRLDDAVVLLQRCLKFQPSHVEGRVELGTALSELGRDDDAEIIYSEGIERVTVVGEALVLRFNRANCRIRRGNLVAAKDDLMTCLSLRPQWVEAKAQLASVLVDQGERRQAKRLLKELKNANADPAIIAKVEERLA